MLKIKVSELEFEVIPIIQNSLSLTHNHLESLSASPYILFVMTERGRESKCMANN